MRRQLANVIMMSNPAEGSLRPFLLAVLTIIAVPNAAHACAMYIPDDIELVAEAPSLEMIFADIDAATADVGVVDGAELLRQDVQRPAIDPATRQLLLAAEPSAVAPQEPLADAQPQS